MVMAKQMIQIILNVMNEETKPWELSLLEFPSYLRVFVRLLNLTTLGLLGLWMSFKTG
jgi:hypothetical protein